MTKPTIGTSTTAEVTLTLKVNVGSWGPDCQLSQVYRQATESAINRIRKLLQHESAHGIQIIGAIKVSTISSDTYKNLNR